MRRPLSASRVPVTLSCPSGSESLCPAAAPGGCPFEWSWPPSAAGGAEAAVVIPATGAVAGEGVLSWSAVETGSDVGGAGSCAGLVGCAWDGVADGLRGGAGEGAATDGGGAELPGTVRLGDGEADGGPGVGGAGQNFAGRRPAGPQGSAAAGNARTSGDATSRRATADA
jgi:hypothetical protein